MSSRVEAVFPEFRGREIVARDGGWDFDIFEIDGEWIARLPRRPDVERWLVAETALLRAVGSTLPVAVPSFELARGAEGVAYRKLPGEPLSLESATNDVASELGEALTSLHAFPVGRALEVGAVDLSGEQTRMYYLDARRREFGERVFPLLARAERDAAERQFEAFDDASTSLPRAVAHRDLGPEHVLVEDGRVTGVIDWADAGVAEPAIDFAWLLHGGGDDFARAVLAAYGGDVDDAFLARARFYHVLGPFYEVVYGQLTDQPELVVSGLAGVRERLERWPPSA